MNRILLLALNDVKHVFRDRLLRIFLFVPGLLIVFVRFLGPYLASSFPEVVEYYPYIMMFGCVQTSILFGFITAFIILEEKDENVLQAIRVLPISPETFIIYRLLFSTVFSAAAAYLMLLFGGLAWAGMLNSLLLALQFGLAAPFISLLIATYAKNKVEGLAFFKITDLAIIVPVTGFFLPDGWKYLFSPIPVFWTYELYDSSLKGTNVFLCFSLGTLCYLLSFAFLMSQFRKRVFDA